MKIRHIIPAALCLLMVSCSDFLDNKPKGYAIPQYFEDYSLINNNIYGIISKNNLFFTDDAYMSDREDYSPKFRFSLMSESFRNAYTFKPGKICPPGEGDILLTDSYKQIYNFNVVANNILNVPDGSQEEKNRVWAEAVVKRAYAYFNLVNNYAVQYNKATAKEDLGIPVVLDEDVTKPYRMYTVQEVYDLLVEDLTKAIPLLPEVSSHVTHVGRSAANFLLAKVYLFMGEFDKALQYAKDAENSNKTAELVDLTQYHLATGYRSPTLQDSNDSNYPKQGEQPDDIWYVFGAVPQMLISSEMLNLYDKDLPEGATDQRKELYFQEDEVSYWGGLYFPGSAMNQINITQKIGISYQELLLMLAECEVRSGASGSIERALGYINELRDHRIINNRPLTATSQTEALRLVLEERRRETATWPNTRYYDLRRLNMEPQWAKTVEHDLDGTTYTLPANDIKYVMPMPAEVLNYNPNLPVYDR